MHGQTSRFVLSCLLSPALIKAPKVIRKIKVKVKVTLVQALRLCTGHTARRGSRGIALLFHNHGTRKG